jgi:hypothetical protein
MNRDLRDLGDLYHDFSMFGAINLQLPGYSPANQRCKGPILTAYIQWAIAKTKKKMDDPVTFTELFCADGYYAMAARWLGAARCYGVDNNRDGWLPKARIIAERLGLTGVEFIEEDVNRMELLERTDIVANVGGLYHVENPKEILEKSYRLATRYLIVQTVISLTEEREDYFETPAPGWTWGSRFNRTSFQRLIRDLGYAVVDSHFNELEGNKRPEDRGSLYYLIAKG